MLKGYGLISSLLWGAAIAFVLYKTVVKEVSDIKTLEKIEKYSLLICSVLPLILPLGYMFFIHDFELSEPPVCYTVFEVRENWKLLVILGLELSGYLIILLFDVWCIVQCIKKLRSVVGDSNNEASDMFYRLAFYPLILLVCVFFPVGLIVIFWDDHSTVVNVLEVFFPSILGFCNSVVYSSNSVIRQEIKTSLRRRLSTVTKARINRLENHLSDSLVRDSVVEGDL